MPERRPESTRGRQVEARRNDLAVLDAARAVVAERGADASVAEIAARAGVGVGSLYRRYGSKTQLIERLCVLAMEQVGAAASAALLVDDPWEGLVGCIRTCVATRAGALAPLAGTLPAGPQMRAAAGRAFDLMERVVARAHADRSLRADVTVADVQLLVKHFARGPATRDDAVERRLVAVAVAGLHAAAARVPLPGPAPTREMLERPWLDPGAEA